MVRIHPYPLLYILHIYFYKSVKKLYLIVLLNRPDIQLSFPFVRKDDIFFFKAKFAYINSQQYRTLLKEGRACSLVVMTLVSECDLESRH
jgi:hypothetical protein